MPLAAQLGSYPRTRTQHQVRGFRGETGRRHPLPHIEVDSRRAIFLRNAVLCRGNMRLSRHRLPGPPRSASDEGASARALNSSREVDP